MHLPLSLFLHLIHATFAEANRMDPSSLSSTNLTTTKITLHLNPDFHNKTIYATVQLHFLANEEIETIDLDTRGLLIHEIEDAAWELGAGGKLGAR